MNILVIDYCCNGVDFAWRLAREKSRFKQVFLMSNSVCPEVWGGAKLRFLPESMDHIEILQLVKTHEIEMTVNFSALHGAIGLVEFLTEHGINAIGSNKIFSDTELNKRDFKHWLQQHDYLTPRIQFEGLMVSVRVKASAFHYPLVIKPDIQIGPAIAILHSADSLIDYLDNVKKKFPAAESSIVFVIEDEIPSQEVVQIHYVISSGKAFVTHSIKALFGAKLASNKLGALVAISPWPGIEQYQIVIDNLLADIAQSGAAAIGTLQCMVGEDGQLYIIENNARPAACNMYDDWYSLSDFIDCLATGDTALMAENNLYMCNPRKYTVGAPLIHHQPRCELTDVEYQMLKATGVHLYALGKDQYYYSAVDKMPSLLVVGGESPAQAVDTFNTTFAAVSKLIPYEPIEMDAVIFSN